MATQAGIHLRFHCRAAEKRDSGLRRIERKKSRFEVDVTMTHRLSPVGWVEHLDYAQDRLRDTDRIVD